MGQRHHRNNRRENTDRGTRGTSRTAWAWTGTSENQLNLVTVPDSGTE